MRGSVAKTHKLLSKHGACSLKVNGSCVFLPMSWAAFWREPILGITNPEFSGLARSLGRESNASRNLYRYILRKNKALPIPITFVQTPVRCCAPGALTKRKKKNVKVKIIPWPCMLLTDWVKVCMEDPKYRGRFFSRWSYSRHPRASRRHVGNILASVRQSGDRVVSHPSPKNNTGVPSW